VAIFFYCTFFSNYTNNTIISAIANLGLCPKPRTSRVRRPRQDAKVPAGCDKSPRYFRGRCRHAGPLLSRLPTSTQANRVRRMRDVAIASGRRDGVLLLKLPANEY
jgi:hypothetical protein